MQTLACDLSGEQEGLFCSCINRSFLMLPMLSEDKHDRDRMGGLMEMIKVYHVFKGINFVKLNTMYNEYIAIKNFIYPQRTRVCNFLVSLIINHIFGKYSRGSKEFSFKTFI